MPPRKAVTRSRQVHVKITEAQDVALTRLSMAVNIDKAEIFRLAVKDYMNQRNLLMKNVSKWPDDNV